LWWVAVGVSVCLFLFILFVWLFCLAYLNELIFLMCFVCLYVLVLDCQGRSFIMAWLIFAQGWDALRTSSAVMIVDITKSIAWIIFDLMKLGLGSSSHIVCV
jgi:hypothetical protein